MDEGPVFDHRHGAERKDVILGPQSVEGATNLTGRVPEPRLQSTYVHRAARGMAESQPLSTLPLEGDAFIALPPNVPARWDR